MRALLLSALLALPAAALSVDEVIELSEAGVSAEIIINQMKADGSVFQLTARQIVELQKKKVPATVINEMVQARKSDVRSDKPMPVPTVAPRPEEPKDSVLTVRNISGSKVTLITYPHDREIAVVKGEIASGTVLSNGSHADIHLPGGIYKVRWANESPFRELAVAGGVTTELEFRDDASSFRGVSAAVLLDGKEEPDPNAPVVVTPPEYHPEPRIYTSPTNSNVTVIRDVIQAPTRVVVVGPHGAFDSTVGYADGTSYSVEPVSRLGITYGYGWSSCRDSYHTPTYRSSSYYRGSSYHPPTIYHSSSYRGHSSHGHGHGHSSRHGYSRVADNVQYYLRWPFGHRHRR